MMMAIVMAGASALSCGSESEASGGKRTATMRIKSDDVCIRSATRLGFQVLVNVNYSKGAGSPYTSRQLFQFVCNIDDGTCEGITFDVDNLEGGGTIRLLDLNRADGGRIESQTGSTLVVKWGPLRTFTVDLARGKVAYVESGDGLLGPVEGRGEASCKATDVAASKGK